MVIKENKNYILNFYFNDIVAILSRERCTSTFTVPCSIWSSSGRSDPPTTSAQTSPASFTQVLQLSYRYVRMRHIYLFYKLRLQGMFLVNIIKLCPTLAHRAQR